MTPDTVRLTLPFGGHRWRLHAPAQMRLADLARLCGELDQRVVAAAVRDSCRDGNPVSCRKGCSACCHQVVPVSAPEAWMLADVVAAMPLPQRRAALARIRASSDATDALFHRNTALTDMAAEAFRSRIPCPFLVDDACSIHATRPTVCREYLVTTPAERCDFLYANRTFVELPFSFSRALADVAATALGSAPLWIPIVQALEWAREHRAMGRRTWPAEALMEPLRTALVKAEAERR